MSKLTEKIARATYRIFTQQKQSGGERFGRWHGKLADALVIPIFDVYMAAMRRHGKPDSPRGAIESFAAGEPEQEWMVAMARAQAQEAAIQINDASTNMLESGRDYKEVFGTDRAAIIALDQEHKAYQNAVVYAAKQKKQKLKWQCDSNPCKICLKIKGKVRNPGKAFAIVGGVPILAPPTHPNCRCVLVEVSA